MNPSELARVAGAMVAAGKGILAADESTGTIKKRFDSIKLWGGSAANVAAAQKEFVRRARLTALAATGRYASDMESRAA
jgi:fructose-bisphosphate aldolase class 1